MVVFILGSSAKRKKKRTFGYKNRSNSIDKFDHSTFDSLLHVMGGNAGFWKAIEEARVRYRRDSAQTKPEWVAVQIGTSNVEYIIDLSVILKIVFSFNKNLAVDVFEASSDKLQGVSDRLAVAIKTYLNSILPDDATVHYVLDYPVVSSAKNTTEHRTKIRGRAWNTGIRKYYCASGIS